MNSTAHNALQDAQNFLYAARTEDWRQADSLRLRLEQLSIAELSAQLTDDAARKAFWINMYNAYIQYLLRQEPERYAKPMKFFAQRQMCIAGRSFSFDDIEHGVLRRSRIRWSLGYLRQIFVPRDIRALWVDEIDHRIHFALNCGASSCPPIAYYEGESIEEQLELAEAHFISSQSEVDSEAQRIHTSKILFWFRGDFGGMRGIRSLLAKQGIEGAEHYKIRYKDYNWKLHLDHFVEPGS